MYRIKYLVLVLVAGVIGYLAAIPCGDFFSASVILYCGTGTVEWQKWVMPFIGLVLLNLIVLHQSGRIIRRHLQSTVVELFRGTERIKREGHYTLPAAGLKHPNLTIAAGELKCKWKEYFVIFGVFVFASFLILLPMNMKHTVEDPSFITYMGVGKCDIRIDLQYSERLAEQKAAALSYLEHDPEIKQYAIFQIGYVQLPKDDGQWEYLRVENGDGSLFPLEYLKGKAPANSGEIALSHLNAVELGKEVGDGLTLVYRGQELSFKVCGIYQDITYGGKTAKAAIELNEADVEVYIIYVDVHQGVPIGQKTAELRKILTDSKVTPIREFVSQTLGGITDHLNLVEGAAMVIALLLTILITMMFLRLITAREHSAIAIKKAIGFSNRDLRVQLGIRILLIQLVAVVVGTLLANFLGEAIFGMMLATMGAATIRMLIEPVKAYLLCPGVQLLAVVCTVVIGTQVVRNYHIRDEIME